MLTLLGMTITTSFFDSLNPSAIAQQLILQAMVKKKWYIWYFIVGIGLANLLMGLAIYYGIATWLSRLLTGLAIAYPRPISVAACLAGIVCMVLGFHLMRKTRRAARVGESQDSTESVKTPARLSPLSLFVMGAFFCLVELTSALPYFGFLAALSQYDLVFPLTLLFVLLYNFMYVLPLILLYFGYNKLQGTRTIQKLEQVLGKVSAYIVPVAVVLVGVVLEYYGVIGLM